MAVRIEIGIDSVMPETLAPFWAAALGYTVGDMDRAGTYLDLVPPDPVLPVVYLQRVPEPKRVKNRVHLDILTTEAEETIGRLTALGARTIGTAMSGSEGGWWQVMADPEGNEFCVCRTE
ncbi:MAG: VOC family protein [Acidimicrobiales bacterium]|jgi:predicted enzyme related to lactoylglutathione lyase